MLRQRDPMQVLLIGLRGTGKTTVGRLLAQALKLPFVDADTVIEARAGRTISEIFAHDGETAFRDLEEQVLGEILVSGSAVIATGGGVVLRESNRRRLRAAGRVIWLTCDVDTLWQRLQRDEATAQRRPNLLGGGRDEIARLLEVREPWYRATSHFFVPTADRSPEEIVQDILSTCPTSSSTMVR